MVNFEKVFIPTIRRLSDLIQKQYGCRFEYLNDTALKTDVVVEIYDLLKSGKPAMNEGSLFFPVMPNGKLMGAAQIAGSQKLGQAEIANLNSTIRLVLESTLMNVDRLDTLNVIEEQLERLVNEKAEISNIISLRELRQAREVNPAELDRWKLKERLSFPFLIEAQSEEDAFRMALEVHDVSGRNFFVPLEDLEAHTFASVENIRSLGACTIYATGFEALTLPVQKMLLDYYQSERGKRSPQIVVGTTISYPEMKTDPTIDAAFLSRLTAGYLYLSQPFNVYKSGDILEFFFDSLTGRTRSQ